MQARYESAYNAGRIWAQMTSNYSQADQAEAAALRYKAAAFRAAFHRGANDHNLNRSDD